MLAMLDFFIFDLKTIDFNKLSTRRTYNFAEIQKAQDHAGLQSLGKDMGSLTIVGSTTTLRSGLNPLQDLYAIADQKLPVSFIYGHGDILGDYLVVDISEDRSVFLEDGKNVIQDFTIELKKVYL